jgi:hypothetical protein
VAARAVWLSEFWLLPYLLLWLWIAVISVLLLVRARRAQRVLRETQPRTAAASAPARSTLSQLTPGSSRPKCPYAATWA